MNETVNLSKPGELNPREIGQFIEELFDQDITEFTQKKSFSPSKVGGFEGTCARYWYYAFKGTDFRKQYSAKSIGNMDQGTSHHERLAGKMAESKNLIESEREVFYDDPPIHGYVDFILDWNGKEVVGEFKTARQESFVSLKYKNKPYDSHVLQLLTYMRVTGIDRGIIVYQNKNDNSILVMPPVYMDEKNSQTVDRAFEWMREARRLWQENILPERPFRRNSKICKKCPVQETCWAGPKGDQKVAPLSIS